jgi:hypothetical protein
MSAIGGKADMPREERPKTPSAGDVLDVGHHRVRQARLAEFREVVNDVLLPRVLVFEDTLFMGRLG